MKTYWVICLVQAEDWYSWGTAQRVTVHTQALMMIKNYEDFADELNTKIKSDDDFYYELLITVIKNLQQISFSGNIT